MVLSRFYSENGTNLEANEIHLMKSELLAKKKSKFLLSNVNSENTMQVIIEILQ